jgi:hypothetical protein
MIRNKDIVKSEGGGWEIRGVADRHFPSREAARQYVRDANLTSRLNNNISKVTDTIQQTREVVKETREVINKTREIVDEDDNAFSAHPQGDFKEVDPFRKAEAQWAKDLASEAGDQTVN